MLAQGCSLCKANNTQRLHDRLQLAFLWSAIYYRAGGVFGTERKHLFFREQLSALIASLEMMSITMAAIPAGWLRALAERMLSVKLHLFVADRFRSKRVVRECPNERHNLGCPILCSLSWFSMRVGSVFPARR